MPETLPPTTLRWALALALAIASALLLEVTRRVLVGRAVRLARRTTNRADDVLANMAQRTRPWFAVAAGLGVGVSVVDLSPRTTTAIGIALLVLAGLQAGLWATALLECAVENWIGHERRDTAAGRTTLGAIRLLGPIVAQSVFGDLFASLAIVLDKPFEVGDFIVVDDFMGTVEQVGLKTTRVRSLSGEQVVFSNSNLLTSRIRNYRRMSERRVEFGLAVSVETTPDQLRQLPVLIAEIIEAESEVRFERAHFKGFAETGLTFEVVYHVLVPDHNRYMDIQQRINLGVCEALAELGVDLANTASRLMLAREASPLMPRYAGGGPPVSALQVDRRR